MIKPVRLQRKRTKGFKLISPNGLPIVYVGRPTKWGNPYKIKDTPDYIEPYRSYAKAHFHKKDLEEELKGKNLACWCSLVDKEGNKVPCHADILLEIANE